MQTPLFLGIDAGGTRTRAVLLDGEGAVLGTGESGPANLVGPEHEQATRRMAEASRAARGPIGPDRIGAVCAGAAGMLSLAEPGRSGEELRGALGVEAPVRLVTDAVAAFAAGTVEPAGTIVIAGTGAVALAVRGHTEVTERADGHGWLLGDAGSGFWMGREAVAATLRHLDGHGPGGPLVQAVIAEISPSSRTSASVVGLCMADSPVRLARFARVVCEAAEDGDTLAGGIVDGAVRHLAATAGAVADNGLPIVLAGSLLSQETPVTVALRGRLAEERPDSELVTAAEPVKGAAWLAARDLLTDQDARKRLHRRLTDE
ncbi:N-acetylglucosamine kinase [Glycomyces xiaoerkulensis]|uniref:N-acetylglucosamine kinase n=1 Tax=Glycomyces xiaoerkulensis TaxID=2038139 RepID=UPI000C269767|nr:BadF/BadG/BcrA/BcrD ATPase family protein [Glycomyces xiaoerkulensis]